MNEKRTLGPERRKQQPDIHRRGCVRGDDGVDVRRSTDVLRRGKMIFGVGLVCCVIGLCWFYAQLSWLIRSQAGLNTITSSSP